MTHVKITSKKGGGYSLFVDGREMSHEILATGFGVTFPEYPEYPATVSCIIAADTLDIDLPEAMLSAVRQVPDIADEQVGK